MTTTAEEIRGQLAYATGTENYWNYRLFGNGPVIAQYTDGIKLMADLCGAHWLIDVVISHQLSAKVKRERFQVWELKKHEVKTGPNKGREYWMVTATDGNDNKIASQRIEYSDFPLDSMKIYFIDRIMLLPSEY